MFVRYLYSKNTNSVCNIIAYAIIFLFYDGKNYKIYNNIGNLFLIIICYWMLAGYKMCTTHQKNIVSEYAYLSFWVTETVAHINDN